MPVMESLWNAKPCICADSGVMAENAADGGCLTVDVRDASKLAAAIQELAANPKRLQQLAQQAIARPLLTWKDYAAGIIRKISTRNQVAS
jgi:glycosyltransferase involved in cell wall biosynthesis